MHGQPNIRQHILYFRAIVKAKTAYQLVTEPAAAEYFFKRARLKIGAVFHRACLRGVFIKNALELPGDKFRLRVGVSPLEIFQVRSGAIVRAKRFAESLGVVGYHRAGGIKDLLCRAEIALQLDDSSGREVARTLHQHGYIHAPPTVEGVDLVADLAD